MYALMEQSVEGQLLALPVYMCDEHNNQKRSSDDLCYELLVASGMWAKVVDKLLPAIFFTRTRELITTLGNEFTSLPDFRADIAHMVSKELAAAAAAFGDRVSWVVQVVGRLRRATEI
jgi:hypothetical protein